MELTAIKIYPFESPDPHRGICAYAEITIDGVLIIRGFKVIRTQTGGLFVGYPSIRKPDGSYRDIVIPADKSVAATIRDSIIEAYKNFDE